mgnify:FL=1
MKYSDRYSKLPKVPDDVLRKKVRPRTVAIVDEDNCTGCQVCVSFCPVDCIEPVAYEKYNIPIPPVQVRFNECIGCDACAKACTDLTWDAIRMIPTGEFEQIYNITID